MTLTTLLWVLAVWAMTLSTILFIRYVGLTGAAWQGILNSLGTPGGNLLLLCIFVSSLLALVVHVLHHSDDSTVTTTILNTFTGFSGALLQSFRGRTSDVVKTNGGNGNGLPKIDVPSSNTPATVVKR